MIDGNTFRLVSKNNKFELIYEGKSCFFPDFIKYSENIYHKPINKNEIDTAFYF